MTIEQRIQIGEYIFNVFIVSKSEHAHSLMTDNAKQFKLHLKGFSSGLSVHPLPSLIAIHKEGKK